LTLKHRQTKALFEAMVKWILGILGLKEVILGRLGPKSRMFFAVCRRVRIMDGAMYETEPVLGSEGGRPNFPSAEKAAMFHAVARST